MYAQVPPKVEYAVTEDGASLRTIVDQLDGWGRWYRERRAADRPRA